MKYCNCAIKVAVLQKMQFNFFSEKIMGENLAIGLQYSSQLEYFTEEDSHIKRKGVLVVLFKGASQVFSLKRSTVGTFVVSFTRQIRNSSVAFNVQFQNWYLLARISFGNFHQASPSFSYGSPAPGISSLDFQLILVSLVGNQRYPDFLFAKKGQNLGYGEEVVIQIETS